LDNVKIVIHAATPSIAMPAALRLTPSTTSATDGTPFWVTLTAVDASGNRFPGYRGTVHFSSSDGLAGLPSDYTFTAADAGTHTFWVTLQTTGNQTITARDTVAAAFNASTTVNLKPAGSLQLTPSATLLTAGTSFTLTVTVLDPSGNIARGYRGTVAIRSTDGQAVLPGSPHTFTAADNGVYTFTVTLKTAGSQTLFATDTVFTTVTGSAVTISVQSAAANHFQIDAPVTVAPNAPFDVTVTALDPYGNVDVNYLGTVHFTSSDGVATLPGDYTFAAADNGVVTFSSGVTLFTAGDQVLTVSDMISAITGSTTVTVSSGGGGGVSGSGGGGGGSGDGEEADPFGNSLAEIVASALVVPHRLLAPTTISATGRTKTVMRSLDLASVDQLFAATAEANHRTRCVRSQHHPFDLAEDGWLDLGSEDNARLLAVS
jgi:hypothetical protein